MEHGIGFHSNSNFKIKINNGRRFRTKIGVNDSPINYHLENIQSIPLSDGKRIFRLVNYDIEIYNSGVMRQGDREKEIDIPLKGGILEMIVEDACDGVSGDHAVWIDPKIEYLEIVPFAAGFDYTDLTETAKVREKEGTSKEYQLSRDYTIKVKVEIPANVYNWLVIE